MRIGVFFAALLMAGAAHAVTISRTESRVEDLQVCIRKSQGDPSFIVSFRTYDEEGDLMREIAGKDRWNDLTAGQKGQIRAIINGVYAFVHTEEQIPTPTPTAAPTPTPGP